MLDTQGPPYAPPRLKERELLVNGRLYERRTLIVHESVFNHKGELHG